MSAAERGSVRGMTAEPEHRRDGSPIFFPTQLDRAVAAFFFVLAFTTLVFVVLLAEPEDGLVDGILPSLLMVLILWPHYYVFWRLYGRRRRQQIAEQHRRGL